MEKIYMVRVVSQDTGSMEWFEKVHQIRTGDRKIATNWVRSDTERMGRRVELIQVEDVREVPHFGSASTDE